MGLDSLMALELRNRLEAETGLKLSATVAWNYPTVARLAEHLAERMDVPLDQTDVPARVDADMPTADVGRRRRRMSRTSSKRCSTRSSPLSSGCSTPMGAARDQRSGERGQRGAATRLDEPQGAAHPAGGGRGRAHEPIAIIGMGCRLPGAADPLAFWELVRTGGDAIGETPVERWDTAGLYDPDPEAAGKRRHPVGRLPRRHRRVRRRLLRNLAREAAQMDPQQRLLLEVAWETLGDGGQAVDRLADSAPACSSGCTATALTTT